MIRAPEGVAVAAWLGVRGRGGLAIPANRPQVVHFCWTAEVIPSSRRTNVNTLKTAFVVLLLLAVLYGVYTVLNRPESQPPKEIAWLKPKDIDSPLVEEGTAVDPAAGLSPRDREPAAPTKRAWGKLANESRESVDAEASREADERERESAEIARPFSPAKKSKFVPPPDLAQADQSKSVSRDESATPSPSRPFRSTTAVAPENSPYDATKTSVDQNLAGNAADSTAAEIDSPPRSSASGGFRDPAVGSSRKDADEYGAPQVQVNPYARDSKLPPAKAAVSNAISNSGNSSAGSVYLARNLAFERAWQTAQTQIADEKWREALLTLSYAFEDPKLTAAERAKLFDVLDPLAAKVIYSSEHLAEAPHAVRRGETLFTIADQHRVPWQLLQNINDVRNPEVIVPGTKLKVVRGPFHADVNLATNELTLYCQRMYAGRFPIEIGADPAPAPGAYDVKAKELGHVFYTADGKPISPDDPRNPYGRCWIDLGRELAIHGSPAAADPRGSTGCISLSPKDADDVLGILSQGSKVTIRR